MKLARIKRFFIGLPIATQHAHKERLPKWQALSTLSSDALSSAAYATDAILVVLLSYSITASVWAIPIALAIAVLLILLLASYRQTIEAYPQGGGAYKVAKENLGSFAGLIAAASLLIDYILTVAVSISAGIENITSAFPILSAHRVEFGLVVILLIMIMNLRGIRESSKIFSAPTYFFIISVFLLIIVGLIKAATGNIAAFQTLLPKTYPSISLLLLFRVFASGCVALTGVEAISNGLTVFQEPTQKNAKITLTWMVFILGAMFLGLTLLAHLYGVQLQENQTVISLLGQTIFGNSILYYFTQLSTAMILFLAANTSYADFPRLSSLLAYDRYIPRQFKSVGDRLVFSKGIIFLSASSALLLILFKGNTLHLIPLYAVGVFISFTLSQTGMVLYHIRHKQRRWFLSLIFNAIGAVATLLVLLDIVYTKFLHGAWIVVLMLPIVIIIFQSIYNHYINLSRQLRKLDLNTPAIFKQIKHTVVVPVSGIHQGVYDAIQYAQTISPDVRACFVNIDEEATQRMVERWKKWTPQIPLVVLESPFRSLIRPLPKYIHTVERITHDDMITVIIPEFVPRKWWHHFLHNQTAFFIRAALIFERKIVVTSIRYHLDVD